MYQINIKTVTAPAFSEGRYSALTPRLTLVVSYTKGGVSFVTGNNISRGYDLSVQYDRESDQGFTSIIIDGKGNPIASLEATARFNAPTLKRIADEVRNGKHDELIRQLYAKAKANRSQHAWPESILPLVEEMAVKGTHNQADQHVLSKREDPSGTLPSFFERIYGIHEESVVKKLPSMKLHELSRLPFKERFKVVKSLLAGDSPHPDAQIVNDIFEKVIAWYEGDHGLSDPNVLTKLTDSKEDLPRYFESTYKRSEQFFIEELPSNEILRIFADATEPWCVHHSPFNNNRGELPSSVESIHLVMERKRYSLPSRERQIIFDDSKKLWCLHFPDFKRISNLMEGYRTNQMLIEYRKHCPPVSIQEKAIEIYKKCLSFRVKLTRKVLSPVQGNLGLGFRFFENISYCIDKNVAKSFVHSFYKWRRELSNQSNKNWQMYVDFFEDKRYDRTSWHDYIKYSSSLKAKADATQKTQEDLLVLLNLVRRFMAESDETISLEYRNNATEMSLYERELEVLQIGEDAADEEYCYVYILECPLCVFYVGIAADPKDRFEQHVRGAFSDEAHLFKSKFIQKFPNRVKYDIVFEGTRRECKQFERDFICENKPLGNMTEGGEG